jgi:hypothetical protein
MEGMERKKRGHFLVKTIHSIKCPTVPYKRAGRSIHMVRFQMNVPSPSDERHRADVYLETKKDRPGRRVLQSTMKMSSGRGDEDVVVMASVRACWVMKRAVSIFFGGYQSSVYDEHQRDADGDNGSAPFGPSRPG